MEEMMDKILSAVLDNQQNISEIKVDLRQVKETQEKMFHRIDDFMVILERHEAEIAALRSAYERLEARLEKLEKQIAA